MTLIEASPKWVLPWEDLEGTISNTTTTYEYEVRRNDYIGTTRIASGSCSTNTGKVSVAIDPDPAPRERRVYEIYIKLTRKGPAFKDNTTYRRHFTVTATKGSVEGMSLLEQQSN